MCLSKLDIMNILVILNKFASIIMAGFLSELNVLIETSKQLPHVSLVFKSCFPTPSFGFSKITTLKQIKIKDIKELKRISK